MKIEAHPVLGWPIVTAANCFDVIRSLGIKPWQQVREPEPLDSFLSHATEPEKDEYRRFGPKNFVVRYRNPHTGEPFNGFRSVFKPAAVVFALLDEHVPVTAEWKHGNDRITIVPVAGVPGKKEAELPTLADRMRATAIREWNEETGTELSSVTPLSPPSGIYSAVRPAEIQYFPFVGRVKEPVVKGPTKFDANEHLKMVLFSLNEWLALIETNELWDQRPEFGLEMCARDVTYAALRELERLKFV
ncbi:MAG: hypothetical protein HY435_03185 [Candidatus Liptonbacteria bacterium]|nr:hypothetical protein [Candidatus Liptonbacteria bacterium]